MSPFLFRTIQPIVAEFVRRVNAAPGQARVTSWWRTPARNAAVGGHPESQHLIGTAADFVPIAPSTYADIARALEGAGLVVVDEGDHVHAQLFAGGVAGPFIKRARELGLFD